MRQPVKQPLVYRNRVASIDRRNKRWTARAATLAAMALLAACATTEKAKESWVGATYDDAVRAWGAPARSGKLADGTEVHTWVSEGAPAYRGGSSVGFGIGGWGGRGGGSAVGVGVGVSAPIGQGSVSPPSRCERTLSFRDGRLVQQEWIGPDEICSEYGREAQK
jgi:hypothetical protein